MIVALVALVCCAAASAATLDPVQEKILQKVVDDVLGGRIEDVRVILIPEPLNGGKTYDLQWSGGTVIPPAGAVWMTVADETPGIMGYHPVRHVFFDADLNILENRPATFYPRFYVNGVRGRWTTLLEIRTHFGEAPVDRQFAPIPSNSKEGTLDVSFNNFYAVIIEGDVPSGSSYGEFWTDNVQLFRMLLEYGYKEENIHVLYGEGDDESTWPCAYYREQMVDFAAYHQNVRDVFTWMRDGNATHGIAKVTSEDFIFLFTFDHGSGSNCNSSLCLMDGCMADTEFASYFNQIAYKYRAVDMQQCNSGGFIDNLENARTVISTAANCNESAWEADESDSCGSNTVTYGEWNYWWMSAMRGHKPWPGEQPVDADVNNNGVVSFLEAHNYAVANDSAGEHPMWSDPGGLGDQLSLVTSYAGPHLIHNAHVLVDDSPGNGDGVANPGETMVMQVTLHNNGEQDASGISGTLSSSSPYVTIQDASATFPDLVALVGMGQSYPDHYQWTADASTPDNTTVDFIIDWTANGGSAVGQAQFQEKIVRVNLAVQQTGIEDSMGGDGDGVADPGEAIQLAVTLKNKGHATARQVRATYSTTSPYATVTDSTAEFPDIPGQVSGRSLAPHFGMTIAPDTPEKTWIEGTLDLSAADGYSQTLPVKFIVGSRGTVLLIEDGDSGEAETVELLINDAGFAAVRQLASETDPSSWSGYNLLVWASGSASSPVSSADQRTQLESYVAEGGRLLIMGGELGYAHRYNESFRTNVLHMASWYSHGGGNLRVTDDDHPIATIPAILPSPMTITTNLNTERDAVNPTTDALMLLDWESAAGRAALVGYDDDTLQGNGGQVISLFATLTALGEDNRMLLFGNAVEWLVGNDKPYLIYAGHQILDTVNGNGDGIADPGETLYLAVDLANRGSGAAASAWVRAWSDHPQQVFFDDNSAAWPLIGSGAIVKSAAPHFKIRLAEDTPCGTVVRVNLDVSTPEGFLGTRYLTFKLGTGGGLTSTYSGVGMPKSIPNPGILDDVINVPDAFRVGNINVAVNIRHSSTTLIKVSLVGPTGTQVILHDHDNSGTEINTIFDSQRQPHGPGSMSDYDGQVATGNWHLYVNDFKQDLLVGALYGWSLIFNTADLCHGRTCSSPLPPAIGNSLVLSRLTGQDVHLTWNSVPNASRYNVWRSSHLDFSNPETAGSSTVTSFDEIGLPQQSRLYLYQVRAENACYREGP